MTAIDSHGNPVADASHDEHDDHHDHPKHLAHHWDNLEQQFEANKLGMWLFLSTEFLLFGGLFVAYAVLRFNQPELFEFGSKFLDTTMGAVNTVILIASSFTMALAVWASQLGKRTLLIWMLALSFLGGLGFMTIKYFEYTEKFHYNIFPGQAYYVPVDHSDSKGGDTAVAGHDGDDGHAHGDGDHDHDHGQDGDHAAMPPVDTVVLDSDAPEIAGTDQPAGATAPTGMARAPENPTIYNPLAGHDDGHGGDHGDGDKPKKKKKKPDPRDDPSRPANAHLFFGVYYCMTGLHGIHVLIGMGVISWLGFRAIRGDFGPDNFTAVDLGGLYWHVVDLIWIFLFPLLYLIH